MAIRLPCFLDPQMDADGRRWTQMDADGRRIAETV